MTLSLTYPNCTDNDNHVQDGIRNFIYNKKELPLDLATAQIIILYINISRRQELIRCFLSIQRPDRVKLFRYRLQEWFLRGSDPHRCILQTQNAGR